MIPPADAGIPQARRTGENLPIQFGIGGGLKNPGRVFTVLGHEGRMFPDNFLQQPGQGSSFHRKNYTIIRNIVH